MSENLPAGERPSTTLELPERVMGQYTSGSSPPTALLPSGEYSRLTGCTRAK
jgi:hypothetical protein